MNSPQHLPNTVKERAIQKLKRELGDDILSLLSDTKTLDVMCNPDGQLWVDSVGSDMKCIGRVSEARAHSIIKTVAAFHGKEVTRYKTLLETTLPLNSERFTAQIEPTVLGPTFNIRTKASCIFPLESYVEKGMMSKAQIEGLKNLIKAHKNILVVGGTGSGKTTLINAIIDAMVKHSPSERLLIIEDTGEIQCLAENAVQFHASIDIDMTKLIKTTLRMRPDRILVGEVRGAEALDLMDAWNTGHEGGAATLHANDAISALTRLKSLVTRSPSAPKEIEPLIAEVVHAVVHIERCPHGRRVSEVISIEGYKNNQYIIKKIA
jgi:type IV secretion system protein VirB11